MSATPDRSRNSRQSELEDNLGPSQKRPKLIAKVKCSGGQPCSTCSESNFAAECIYPTRDRQVKVTQSYIDGLLKENTRLRQESAGSPRSYTSPLNEAQSVVADSGDAARNPLLEERPWFFPMNTMEAPIHVGEAADAAFATRFRQALSDVELQHIPRTDYVPDRKIVDSSCPWPSPARARFFVKVALETVCHCYYIVRKSVVLRDLDIAIRSRASVDGLSMCRLWALFALGEVYSTRNSSMESHFPGLAYFGQASKMLRVLSERPRLECIEVILLLSFYSLTLNRRHSAYYLAGSAVRLAIVMGLHLNVPEFQLRDRELREHRKRVWWTAYIFDRMWASKMGQPLSVHEDDIEVDKPSALSDHEDFGDADYLVAYTQLAKLAGHINSSIYGRRMQQGSFAQRTQLVLKELTNWVENLPSQLQIRTDEPTLIVPKNITSLHLSFNQCVIMATRPVLLHVLSVHRKALQTSQPSKSWKDDSRSISESALALVETCIRCARHSYRLLIDSWVNGSFFMFDYLYTQYLFSTITVLAISSLLDGNDGDKFETGADLLLELKQHGNFAGVEFTKHVIAMKLSMDQYRQSTGEQTSQQPYNVAATVDLPLNSAAFDPPSNGSFVTAGMALTEPSLQEFLSQPDFDLSFMGMSTMYNDPQGLYLPGLDSESWAAGETRIQ